MDQKKPDDSAEIAELLRLSRDLLEGAAEIGDGLKQLSARFEEITQRSKRLCKKRTD